jgi:hypothetical protein
VLAALLQSTYGDVISWVSAPLEAIEYPEIVPAEGFGTYKNVPVWLIPGVATPKLL